MPELEEQKYKERITSLEELYNFDKEFLNHLFSVKNNASRQYKRRPIIELALKGDIAITSNENPNFKVSFNDNSVKNLVFCSSFMECSTNKGKSDDFNFFDYQYKFYPDNTQMIIERGDNLNFEAEEMKISKYYSITIKEQIEGGMLKKLKVQIKLNEECETDKEKEQKERSYEAPF